MKCLSCLALFFVTWNSNPAVAAQLGNSSQRVLVFTASSMPTKIAVMRGAILEFKGALKNDTLPRTVYLRLGTILKSSGEFKESWRLRWDSSREIGSTYTVGLVQIEPNGQETRLGRMVVELLDEPPFKITSPQVDAATSSRLEVSIEATGRLKFTGGEVMIDRISRNAKIDEHGKGEIVLAGVTPGKHLLSVKVQMEGGGDFETDPVSVLLKPLVTLSRKEVGPLDLREPRAALRLCVDGAGELKAKSVEVTQDGKVVLTSDSPPFDDLVVPITGLTTGIHRFRAEIMTADGTRHITSELKVDVVGNSVSEYVVWRDKIRQMLDNAETLRGPYLELERRWLATPQTEIFPEIGEFVVALKKLLEADTSVAEGIDKIPPPSSLSKGDQDTLASIVDLYKVAFSNMVTAERLLRDFLQGREFKTQPELFGKYFNGNYKPYISRALVNKSLANERLIALENRVARDDELISGGRKNDPSDNIFAYPEAGDLRRDFASWRAAVNRVVNLNQGQWSEVKSSESMVDRELAVRKLIGGDNWLSASIAKVRLPKSASGSVRTEMAAIVQTIEGAASARFKWAKLYLAEIDKSLELNPTAGAPDLKIGSEAFSFLSRHDIMLAEAKDRMKKLATRLGVGE